MSADNNNHLLNLIDVTLGFAKDKAFHDALIRIQEAQREYLCAEADAKRGKERSIINAMAKLDIETTKLKFEYRRIQPVLSSGAQIHFDKLFDSLQAQRERLVQEKKIG